MKSAACRLSLAACRRWTRTGVVLRSGDGRKDGLQVTNTQGTPQQHLPQALACYQETQSLNR